MTDLVYERRQTANRQKEKDIGFVNNIKAITATRYAQKIMAA
jgi:hypothetical protein